MSAPDPSSPPLPWASNPYSIKQHGLTIDNCDREPVQTPGCIQAHGVLFVLNRADLTVLQVSENVGDHFPLTPQEALGRTIGGLSSPEVDAQIAATLVERKLEANPYCVTSHVIPAQGGKAAATYDVIIHTVGELVLTEFVPIVPREDGWDYYAQVKSAVSRLQAAKSLTEFSDLLAEEVKRITGLDRAMIYKFHPDFHGEVVAEAKREDLESWKGLHYPAEDIPHPAREIFRQIWVRPVPDIDGALAEMVPLANPLTGKPLPMTHCVLRGASVMYTEYLRNMKVTAALTMSLRDGDQLWGMIACHHYSGPFAVGLQARSACELLAQVASLLIHRIEEREHLLHRLEIDGVHQQILAKAAQEGDLSLLVNGNPSLLSGIPATGLALRWCNRWWRAGVTPRETTLDGLTAWLAEQPHMSDPLRPIFLTDRLPCLFPLSDAEAALASGLMAVPVGDPRSSVLIWFRGETLQSVKWAGNPNEKPMVTGPHGPRLTPRASFELFVESVHHRSVPWDAFHVTSALQLRSLIQTVVVSRTEQISRLNLQLEQSNEELDSFAHIASHDLKEPLRGIYKYAHQIKEESAAATEEDKKKLDRLLRLTVRMDALLDSLLQYSRVGRTALLREDVDMNELVQEARESIYTLLSGKPQIQITLPRPLPMHNCDPIRIREVFTNLLSNAVKYSTEAGGRIEIGHLTPEEARVQAEEVKLPRDAQGETVFYVRDSGIGVPEQHAEAVFELFRRLHPRDSFGGGTGVGLTIVKRSVERHGGVIWLTSSIGKGTTFYFTLPHPKSAP